MERRSRSQILISNSLRIPAEATKARVVHTLDGAEKRSVTTAPYGRGSESILSVYSDILSRDHRERFFSIFSTGFSL